MVNDDRPLFQGVDELEQQLKGKPDKRDELDERTGAVDMTLRTPTDEAEPRRDDEAGGEAPTDR